MVNECQEYHVVGDAIPPTYVFFASHELKRCDGLFGVDAPAYAAFKDYSRRLKKYILNLEAQVNQCE